MVNFLSTTIILTALAVITSLILLSSTAINGHSQNLEVPDFKPKSSANVEVPESSAITPAEEIAMKIQLEEHSNEILANNGWYEVSDFAFIASNASKLCPSGTCGYELDDGEMTEGASAGDRSLTGKFKVDTGESKKVMNMRATWETVEERETPEGDTINVIEGDFGVGRNEFSPEHKYQITGTLTPDGDGYILEAKGKK
jgi:hypothetical protein